MNWRKEFNGKNWWLELNTNAIFWNIDENYIAFVRNLTDDESDYGCDDETLELEGEEEETSNEYAIVNIVSTQKFLEFSKILEAELVQSTQPKNICQQCGRKLKVFHHNCPNSVSYDEKFGCPFCDDVCPACKQAEVE